MEKIDKDKDNPTIQVRDKEKHSLTPFNVFVTLVFPTQDETVDRSSINRLEQSNFIIIGKTVITNIKTNAIPIEFLSITLPAYKKSNPVDKYPPRMGIYLFKENFAILIPTLSYA
jgi:hypothetical protein